MLPYYARILKCPYCGTKKEIMSLASGNTFGAQLWSDNKRIAPMLPEISYIQKCPHCGKYYITARQKTEYSHDKYSFEKGILTFPEMKEAFGQLYEEGFQSRQEETNTRMMLHHAYNDFYYRDDNSDSTKITDSDKHLFHDNGLWLINNFITDPLLKAEFFREIGEMKQAKEWFDIVFPNEEFQKHITTAIKERIDRNDSSVFLIQ